MDYLSLVGLSFGLACDAFAVSVTEGAYCRTIKLQYAFRLAFFFGIFQAIMPVLGWVIGKSGENLFRNIQRLVGFGILAILGIKMIWDYYDNKKQPALKKQTHYLSLQTVVFLAFATSIDAFACGIILPTSIGADTLVLMIVSVGIIGMITFIVSLSGVYTGKFFGCLFSDYATLFGGIILLIIGVKILV